MHLPDSMEIINTLPQTNIFQLLERKFVLLFVWVFTSEFLNTFQPVHVSYNCSTWKGIRYNGP